MNTPQEIFDELAKRIQDNHVFHWQLSQFNAIFEFWIDGTSGGVWHISAIPELVGVWNQPSEMPPSCTIRMTDANFVKLANGKLNLKKPWNWWKIKIEGDRGLAMKLGELFK